MFQDIKSSPAAEEKVATALCMLAVYCTVLLVQYCTATVLLVQYCIAGAVRYCNASGPCTDSLQAL